MVFFLKGVRCHARARGSCETSQDGRNHSSGFLSSVLGVGVRFLVAMVGSLGLCREPPQVKSLRTEPLPFHHPRWGSWSAKMAIPLKKSEGLVRARRSGLIILMMRLSR